MLLTSSKLKAFNDGLVIVSGEAFQGAANVGLVNELLMTTNAIGAKIVIGWLGALPGMEKLRGEPRKKSPRTSDFAVENFEWENTLTVPAIDIFRDNIGTYKPMAAMLGVTSSQHPLELVGSALVNGFTGKDYTGSAFFAANKKPWAGATSFSNKGTKKLSAANYETAYLNLLNRKNAFGKPMRLGRQLALVVSPTNHFVAKEIVEVAKSAAGADNKYYGTAKVIVLQDLAIAGTGDEWFLMELGYPVKPLFKNEEIPYRLLTDTSMEGREYIENHEFIWQGYYSGNVGYGLPELAYGSDGTQAA